MRKSQTMSLAWLSTAVLVLCLMSGCGSRPEGDSPTGANAAHSGESEHHEGDGHDHEHNGHDHPSDGPHHGHLIELGNEEYHAELVHDDASQTVTIYLLNSTAKEQVAIEATELTVNLKHDGKGEQFKITASPDKKDPSGKSSRFVSNDAELAEDLDREGADAVLVVTISGKSYRGTIVHDHGDHDHGGHENGEGHDH